MKEALNLLIDMYNEYSKTFAMKKHSDYVYTHACQHGMYLSLERIADALGVELELTTKTIVKKSTYGVYDNIE